MLSELLTSGPFWFWTLLIVQSALIIWFVETGSAIGAGVSAGALLAGLLIVIGAFPGQWDSLGLNELAASGLWAWLGSRWQGVLAALGSYMLVGVAWATFRWWFYVRDLRERYEQTRTQWLHPENLKRTAARLTSRASTATATADRDRYLAWSQACSEAAANGGKKLTRELKPAWKDYLERHFNV